jgi:hypothetical protein
VVSCAASTLRVKIADASASRHHTAAAAAMVGTSSQMCTRLSRPTSSVTATPPTITCISMRTIAGTAIAKSTVAGRAELVYRRLNVCFSRRATVEARDGADRCLQSSGSTPELSGLSPTWSTLTTASSVGYAFT